MFQKPFRVKTQTSVKSSDRKKLRADIKEQYPSLSEDDILKLVPNKEEMSMVKIHCHGGENVLVYCVQKQPVFYDLFKKLFPTVYTLWHFPDILPVFRTWPAVFEKLQKGADLMLPGVIPDREPSPKMFGNLHKGQLVGVTIAGNKCPVAIGKALLSGEDMYMSALRGKGVSILHILGDTLWELGDKSSPPNIPEPLPSSAGDNDKEGDSDKEGDNDGGNQEETDDVHIPSVDGLHIEDGTEQAGPSLEHSPGGVEACSDTHNNGDADGDEDEEDEDESKDPVAEMDELLHFCFACAVKAKVKKSELPLLTGNFLRSYMQPFSPDKQLDLKKSSFKKFSKFLQSKVTEGYICMKEQSKGVDVITEVDRSHLGLRELQVPEVKEEESAIKGGQGEEESYSPLSFTDVYCVNAVTSDIFKPAGFSKGDALTVADVRQTVTNYVRDNELQHQDKKLVVLDPVLAHTILKPAEGDLDRMNWEQVINRVMGKMQAGVAISSGSGPPVIRKGKLDPIKLDVVMRASSKKVTLIDNLEDYGIDVKQFARHVQRSVASSCSVAPSEQKNKGAQVMVQGNQVSFVGKLLLEKYKIPKRYLVGLDHAPKQKKKR